MDDITFEVRTNIDPKKVQNLLTCAMEGGSNYWYNIVRYDLATGVSLDEFRFPHIEVPFRKGCAILIGSDEYDEPPKRLDWGAMQDGLHIMQKDYLRHFNDFMIGNEDAITGDVFLQCCLYKEVVFG